MKNKINKSYFPQFCLFSFLHIKLIFSHIVGSVAMYRCDGLVVIISYCGDEYANRL